MAKKIVTLYIDSASLRLMETSGRKIRKQAYLPLNPAPARDNDGAREEEVAGKIKQLFRSKKVRTKKVVVGLSGLQCLTRPVVLPQMPRAMLEEAVVREARRALPVPPEQLYISWHTMPSNEPDKIKVFLVAIPRHIADGLFRILHHAGLKPTLIDIKPIALARAANTPTAIIVDVQPTEFDIAVMVDGVPQPVRSIPFPNQELPLQEKMTLVKNDLNRTIEFHNSNNPDRPITSDSGMPIIVSGELVASPEEYQAFGDELGYPVTPMESPLKPHKELDPSYYMVNAGLTLKGLQDARSPLAANVNCIPAPYHPKPISISKLIAAPAAVTVIGALVLMVTNIQDVSANIASVQSQLDTANHIIQHRHSQKQELLDNIDALKSQIAAAQSSAGAFTGAREYLDSRGETVNGDLAASVNHLPEPATLTRIGHSGSTLTVSGRAPSEVDVLNYASSLEATQRFTQVTITAIARVAGEEEGATAGGAMNFTITLGTEEEEE